MSDNEFGEIDKATASRNVEAVFEAWANWFKSEAEIEGNQNIRGLLVRGARGAREIAISFWQVGIEGEV
jgi:hypothetical protein